MNFDTYLANQQEIQEKINSYNSFDIEDIASYCELSLDLVDSIYNNFVVLWDNADDSDLDNLFSLDGIVNEIEQHFERRLNHWLLSANEDQDAFDGFDTKSLCDSLFKVYNTLLKIEDIIKQINIKDKANIVKNTSLIGDLFKSIQGKV